MKIEPNQSFGLIVGGTLLILFTIMPSSSGSSINIYTTIIGLFFIFSAIFKPQILTPLNYIWLEIGKLLHKITSPIILGFIFFIIITPIGLCLRFCGKDILKLNKDQKLSTYWQQKEEIEKASFIKQF